MCSSDLYNGSNVSYNHQNLNANTTYYYKAWSVGSGNAYSSGITASATTPCTTYLPVSITITASANPVCSNTAVLFTANIVNGGSSPVFQWKVNGVNVGSSAPSLLYTPMNNDQIICMVTSNASCVTGNPAISNAIFMTVNPNLIPGIISANQTICANTKPAVLTSTPPLNGQNPSYQWQSSLDNVTFQNISGATDTFYQPGNLLTTTWYRQMQNATNTCGGPLPTNQVVINVIQPVDRKSVV